MADINSLVQRPGASVPTNSSDRASTLDAGQGLVTLVELLFFAYRDFTADPDAVLSEFGFGRAHHRVLHFVQRHPGLRVADLLDILRITKQSLSRVLKQLIDEGYVTQRAGTSDRRERLLYVTPQGAALADKLVDLQIRRIAEALTEADRAQPAATAGERPRGTLGEGDAKTVVERFLFAMIADEDRARVRALIGASA